jgi:hypothetical protein
MSDKVNQATNPADLRNHGLKCHDCGSKDIVYAIAVTSYYFPFGAYCYKCLLNRVKVSKRVSLKGVDEYYIPTPIPWNLMTDIKHDLRLEKASQTFKI